MADDGNNVAMGFVCCLIAILFFGSNYVPVKKFDAGDGFFFQWVNCIGIWFVGLILASVVGFPDLNKHAFDDPEASVKIRNQLLFALGGSLWAFGNVLVVPVIKAIGLTLGLCLWGSSNMLVGWLSGITGWFGVGHERAQYADSYGIYLNVLGAVCALSAAVCYALIIPSVDSSKKDDDDADSSTRTPPSDGTVPEMSPMKNTDKDEEEEKSALVVRMTGLGLALLAGCFYGLNFNPVFAVKNAFGEAPLYCVGGNAKLGPNAAKCEVLNNVFYYVFWHFTGIMVLSSIVFLVYCGWKKNKPVINPEIILPAFASGCMWAVAQISWFYAIQELGFSTAFPLITSGPGLIGALWGLFVFKEIEGRRNYLLLGGGFMFVIIGGALIAFSRRMGNDKIASDNCDMMQTICRCVTDTAVTAADCLSKDFREKYETGTKTLKMFQTGDNAYEEYSLEFTGGVVNCAAGRTWCPTDLWKKTWIN